MTSISPSTTPLPVGSTGRHANGWWGMIMLITTEAALFVYLLFAYYYTAVQHGRDWLPDPLPGIKLSVPNTIILLLSSVVVWRGERFTEARRFQRARRTSRLRRRVDGCGLHRDPGAEWAGKTFTPFSSSYGSLYFMITGFHMLHVAAGVIILVILTLWTELGYFDRRRTRRLQYWRDLLALRRHSVACAVLHLLRVAASLRGMTDERTNFACNTRSWRPARSYPSCAAASLSDTCPAVRLGVPAHPELWTVEPRLLSVRGVKSGFSAGLGARLAICPCREHRLRAGRAFGLLLSGSQWLSLRRGSGPGENDGVRHVLILSGVLISALFTVAILFNTVYLGILSTCSRA